MNKILEIKFCQQCSNFINLDEDWCGKEKRKIDINPEQGFPSWCPLGNAVDTKKSNRVKVHIIFEA